MFSCLLQIDKMRADEKRKEEEQDLIRVITEKDHYEVEMSLLKQELELAKKTYEKNCSQLETQARKTKVEYESKLMELELLLNESRKKVKELETFSQSKSLRWRRKEHGYKHFIDTYFASLQVCVHFVYDGFVFAVFLAFSTEKCVGVEENCQCL